MTTSNAGQHWHESLTQTSTEFLSCLLCFQWWLLSLGLQGWPPWLLLWQLPPTRLLFLQSKGPCWKYLLVLRKETRRGPILYLTWWTNLYFPPAAHSSHLSPTDLLLIKFLLSLTWVSLAGNTAAGFPGCAASPVACGFCRLYSSWDTKNIFIFFWKLTPIRNFIQSSVMFPWLH